MNRHRIALFVLPLWVAAGLACWGMDHSLYGEDAEAAQIRRRGAALRPRVIEMGTLIAGPFCGQILGDFGAEVIKLEDPRAGDPMRQWGRSLPKGLSPWWPVIGRNKKSVGARPAHSPRARRSRAGLIGQADVRDRELPARRHGEVGPVLRGARRRATRG